MLKKPKRNLKKNQLNQLFIVGRTLEDDHRVVIKRKGKKYPKTAILSRIDYLMPDRKGELAQALISLGLDDLVSDLQSVREHIKSSDRIEYITCDLDGAWQLSNKNWVISQHGASWLLGELPKSQRIAHLKKKSPKKIAKEIIDGFNQKLTPIINNNPRVLAMVLWSLAALVKRPFNLQLANLVIYGESSSGKSQLQKSVSLMVNNTNKLEPILGTESGLFEVIRRHKDKAIFFEDAQDPNSYHQLANMIMQTGNGGGRTISTTHGQNECLSSTIILSSEKPLAEIAIKSRSNIHTGVFGRTFEMGLGNHGVFDELQARTSGSEESNKLLDLANMFNGLLATAFLNELASNWEKHTEEWKQQGNKYKELVRPETNEEDYSNTALRLIESIAFVAFCGKILFKGGILIDKKKLGRGFRLITQEYINKFAKNSNPVQSYALDELKGQIQANLHRLDSNNNPGTKHKNIGTTKEIKNEKYYLIKTSHFEKMLGKHDKTATLAALDSKGLLLTSHGRNNRYQMRHQGIHQDFYAVSARILQAD